MVTAHLLSAITVLALFVQLALLLCVWLERVRIVYRMARKYKIPLSTN